MKRDRLLVERILSTLRADSQASMTDIQLSKALGNVDASRLSHHLLLLQDHGLVEKTPNMSWRLTWNGHDRADGAATA
ncbi:hypothetical protein [Cupriavidus sp. IDO]|jgi:hypothetical protein|uniref:hypothetical protein n=1 Tax=Cupriavidus sp. IDO TaxID=1539142 RepID=UPI0005795643|nr:hypothetical protein [Cupriavidus sp. IDO]KWR74956.1 hypothetical protein RM96_34695 [Cupriavidus sp. IDO]